MSNPPDKKRAAAPPTDSIRPIQPVKNTEPAAEVPRSGTGAGTALFAMLRKRQMRATRDTEPEAQPPLRKSANE